MEFTTHPARLNCLFLAFGCGRRRKGSPETLHRGSLLAYLPSVKAAIPFANEPASMGGVFSSYAGWLKNAKPHPSFRYRIAFGTTARRENRGTPIGGDARFAAGRLAMRFRGGGEQRGIMAAFVVLELERICSAFGEG
jgi:hypothetical protein